MVITIKENASKNDTERLKEYLNEKGYELQIFKGTHLRVIGVVGDTINLDENLIMAYPCVQDVKRVVTPFKKASRVFHPENTIIDVRGIPVGGKDVVIIGGPCSVEGLESTLYIAENIRKFGGTMLRGGAYKPRTSPYAFQGLKEEGIYDLVVAREKTNLPIVSEIVSLDNIDEFIENVDIIQIGARNMQNFELLKTVGRINKPVLLKRGISATIEEWLLAAEYILNEGNPNVILCERGIRTFEKATRNTLDLSAIPVIKKLSHLPIFVDPSHGTGRNEYVEPMALAAIAAGADGLIVEVHNCPQKAWSDGGQCLTFNDFAEMVDKCNRVAHALDRKVYGRN